VFQPQDRITGAIEHDWQAAPLPIGRPIAPLVHPPVFFTLLRFRTRCLSNFLLDWT
jgi:hypothetical protein